METEDLHGPNQRMQPLHHQGLRVMRQQRCANGLQIGQEVLGAWIGILRRHRMPRGLAAGERLQRRGQARVDSGQGTPVGLVLAMFVGVGGARGQGLHLRAHVDQHGRERQFAPEVVDLGQVVAQGDFGLPPQGVFERLRADVWIAVAVAANPLAHAQEARHRLLAKLPLQAGVEPGDLTQERGLVVAQRVLDLVGHRETGEAQQAGLPELEHARADLQFVGGELARRQRVPGQRVQPDLVARDQQVRDVALRVQDALALDFGGVRGEHRRQVGLRQCLRDGVRRDARPAQARQRDLDASCLGLARTLVQHAATDVMAVLGEIGQMAEVGEGADHAHRLLARQRLEQPLERPVRPRVGVAAKGDRQFADPLDQLVGSHAFLVADHVSQDPAEQPDVLDQRPFIVFRAPRRGSRRRRGHGWVFLQVLK